MQVHKHALYVCSFRRMECTTPIATPTYILLYPLASTETEIRCRQNAYILSMSASTPAKKSRRKTFVVEKIEGANVLPLLWYVSGMM